MDSDLKAVSVKELLRTYKLQMEIKIMSDDMSTFDDFDDDAFIRDSSDGLFDFDVDEPLIATDMCSLDEQEGVFSFDSEAMGMAFALAEDIAESDRVGYGFSHRRNSRMNDSFRTRCLNDGFDDDELPMDPEEMYIIKYGDKYFQ